MSDHPCTAAKEKSFVGAFGERCGNIPTTRLLRHREGQETVIGWLCESCFQYTIDNYEGSLLKMLRDATKKD